MKIDSMAVRTSLKNAVTAKALYDMPSEALDKTMDGITGEQTVQLSKPNNNKAKRKKKKEKKPDPKVPDYKQDRGQYFLFLANELRYEKFANDVQALSPEFVKRSVMDALWYKTLRTHYGNWEDKTLTHSSKKKMLSQANAQTGGYEGYDSKAYWELQKVVNGMEGMSVDKEVDVKNPHFLAMNEARKKKKAERRLAAMSDEQKRVGKKGLEKDTDTMEL